MDTASSQRILLIDDNEQAAHMLATVLSRLKGHQVEIAHDGVSGVEVASQFQPDVVFLDIGLPGMDGYQVARKLRHEIGLSHAFLIALTGYSGEEEQQKAAEAGVDLFLVKPPSMDAIDKALQQASSRAGRAGAIAASPSPAPTVSTVNTAETAAPPTDPDIPGRTLVRDTIEISKERKALGKAFRELAHELGNHLSPLQLILRQINSPRVEEFSLEELRELLEAHLPSMNHLLDTLREFSSIASGALRPMIMDFPLTDILRAAIEECKPLWQEKGLTIACELPDTPVSLQVDPALIQEAFVQLLKNAIQHTDPPQSIVVSAQIQEQEVIVHVRDEGKGIPLEWLPHIFEMFVCEEQAFSFKKGRLGVGLPLASNIIKAHGGTIEAFSAGANQGSELLVHLPLPS